jgi:hypothetical protein
MSEREVERSMKAYREDRLHRFGERMRQREQREDGNEAESNRDQNNVN